MTLKIRYYLLYYTQCVQKSPILTNNVTLIILYSNNDFVMEKCQNITILILLDMNPDLISIK